MTEPSHAVFISYASQDTPAAQRICEAMRAAGIEVWFDQSELRGGDAWDRSIRKHIKTYVLFIPVISRNTHERDEGYFRLEWKLAVDRSHLMTGNSKYGRPVPSSELAKHIQLVLTDRSTLSKGQERGVISQRTWRLADLGAKHAFLRAGLGWGGMPAELVRSDLSRGSLVKVVAEDAPNGYVVSMRAVYRTDAPPGIAGRWFIDRLKQGREAAPSANVQRHKRALKKRG